MPKSSLENSESRSPNNSISVDNVSGDHVLPVALDAMGGDLGSKVQVDGAIRAYKDNQLRTILVGPKAELEAHLKSLGGAALPLEIVDAPEIIEMTDSPARAIRKKPNSSLCVAYQLVMEGRASAILSSGNSGAMMAAGRMLGGIIPGIERPAIATLIPTVGDGNPNVVMDSGANVDCHAQNFVQFAVMGGIYCKSLFGIDNPKIALLSNGEELSKGTDVIRTASQILTQMNTVNYVGYVEGRDVTGTKADVIICDGFVGNVLLKAMEGCVSLIYKQIIHERRNRPFSQLGLWMSRRVLKAVFKDKFDYAAVGGAPLLGLKHLALVLHGSSDARAVSSAIRLANVFVENKMTEKITYAMSRLEEKLVDLDGSFVSVMLSSSMNGPFSKNSETPRYKDSSENPSEEHSSLKSVDDAS